MQAGFTGTYIINPTSHENVKMMAAVTIIMAFSCHLLLHAASVHNNAQNNALLQVNGYLKKRKFGITDDAERANEQCGETAM